MEFLSFKKPLTPSLRHTSLLKLKLTRTVLPSKIKTFNLKRKAGRNHCGSITVFRKGGGHKRRYRLISSNSTLLSGVVESIEYDPYRSSNVARIYFSPTKSHFYILAPQGLKRGHYIKSQTKSQQFSYKIGHLHILKNIPLGVFLHNISFSKTNTAAAKSAGCSVQLISKTQDYCRLRMPSGEHRIFGSNAQASIGVISNLLHKQQSLGKAGRSRWLNRRPIVRGVAMNPIDHPHGGKTAGGCPPVTPWGKLTKNQSTKKSPTNTLIVKSRKSKK